MAITEEQRHRMYQRLEEVLGAEFAATLMEHLPPVGWADVATKRDLDHSRSATKHDLDRATLQLRAELADLGAGLRTEIADLGASLRGGAADLGASLWTEMADLKAELHQELRHHTYATLGGVSAIATVAVAFAQLI